MDYTKLFALLHPLLSNKNFISESWGFLNLKGNYFTSAAGDINKLCEYLESIGKRDTLTIKFDNDNVSKNDFNDFINIENAFQTWEINLNKLSLIFKNDTTHFSHSFFCETTHLEKWIDNLNPLDCKNPFHIFSPLKIVTKDLLTPIAGSLIQIIPSDSKFSNIQTLEEYSLPPTVKINEIVHIVSSDEVCINPKNFIVSKSDLETPLGKKLMRLASISLAACIVNEYYSKDKVFLDGIRPVNIKLYDSIDTFSSSLIQSLQRLISWVYSEKVSTRLKLFNDTLTLEMDESNSLINELNSHLEIALRHAEQRYNFVILERKDKYIAELKDLLKDIRTQSDLYAQKIRTLLNNLLRDILAAIVLIGFTIFTKFSDNLELDKDKLLDTVFTGLAIYYLISIALQTVVDMVDVAVSKKEMLYWKSTTAELLPEKDFTTHINTSLKGRRNSLRIIYPLIICVYLLAAYACFKFPNYFHKISIPQ